MVLREDSVPVVQMARRVPLSLQEPLRQELDRLLQAGIIAKTEEPTDWMSPLEKLNCGPVVEIWGDDMAHVVWDLVHERLIEPYVDADLTVFDISMKHRHQINGTVTLDAPQALKIRDVGVKCATITAEKVVLEKYYLKRMWMSPNTAIRNALGGAVFPELIVCRNIPPRVKQWCRPIIIARHAFRDQYNGKDFVVPRPGTLQIKYSPTIGARYNLELEHATPPLLPAILPVSSRDQARLSAVVELPPA
ncbi:isocitrate dehydrogenase [NADP] cytoplasmic-like [Dermacentor silvarum]|uniref:isocitrate dehydrogenase [NADP] cytoplasmic-like n=1 Tax=Dermacentor silvarum TaxID=543639 RepID=UPI001896F8D0|nr:isocitrate dehydrogenase [NADP] cytoplasmic-like [Dermacentor silvarum]